MAFRRSIYEDGGTDSSLDEGHDAFLMAQGKTSLGGDAEKSRLPRLCIWFLVPLRFETWKNIFYLWFINFPFGLVTSGVALILVSLALGMLPLCCLGVLILANAQYVSAAFASAELWLLSFFYKKSLGGLYRPPAVAPDDDGLISWGKAHLSAFQAWKDLFYFFFLKFPISFSLFLLSFLTVGISLACCLSILIFYSCPNCIENGNLCIGSQSYPGIYGRDWLQEWTNGTCNSGWHISRIQDCIGLTILGVPFLYLSLFLTNYLAVFNYKASACFLSDHVGGSSETLLGYDPKAGMFGTAPTLSSQIRERQTGRKIDLEMDRETTKGGGGGGGGGYLPEFGDSD